MAPCKHDLKLSPLRVRGTGFDRSVRAITGHRAKRVRGCVKCGAMLCSGGIDRDPDYTPAAHGSATEVLKWIDQIDPAPPLSEVERRECNPRWRKIADPEKYPDRPGNLPPIAGAAAKVWTAASASTWATAASWTPSGVPAANDSVQFGNGSGATQSNCTISANTNAVTSIVCTGYTGTLTLGGGFTLSLGGSTAGAFTLVTGMTFTSSGTVSFGHTVTGCTFDMAGQTGMAAVSFQGTGGGWTQANGGALATPFVTASFSGVTLTAGTLNLGNFNCSWGTFAFGAGTGVLTLGSSTITMLSNSGNAWNAVTNTANKTVNSNTSTIVLSAVGGFTGGTYTWNAVSFTTAGAPALTMGTGGSIGTLTRTGTAVKTDTLQILSAVTVTVSAIFTGNSLTNRLIIQSNTVGSAWTLTCAAVTLTNVDFMDITAAGAATWSGTSVGNALGNTSITFTTTVTRYFVGSNTSASSTSSWSSTSGGSSGASVPLCHDTVIFDGNSAGSCTADMPRFGASITMTGFTHTLTLNTVIQSFGDLTMATGMTLTPSANAWQFYGRGSQTFTPAALTFSSVYIIAPGGTITLGGALTSSLNIFVQNGTFVDAGFAISCMSFTCNGTTTRAATLTGTTTCTGPSGAIWNFTSTGLTWSHTGTVAFSNAGTTAKTFAGAGLTYGTLSITSGGTGAVTLTGANRFSAISCTGPKSIVFPSSTTTTITTAAGWQINGSSGNLVTITASTSGTAATISIASGTVSAVYLSLKDSTATGGASFYAGVNSTSVSNNTGWNFTAPNTSFSLTGAETTASVDSMTRLISVFRTGSETSASSDSAKPVDVLGRATSEASSSSDALSVVETQSRSIVDTSVSSDAETRLIALHKTSSDTSVSSDAAKPVSTFTRTAGDTSNSSDALSSIEAQSRAISDTSTSSDAASRQVSLHRTSSDTSNSSDTASVSGQSSISRTGFETSLTSDATQVRIAVGSTTSDTSLSSATGSTLTNKPRTMGDTSATSDTLGSEWILHITGSETTVSVDTSSTLISLQRACTDTSLSSDSMTVVVGRRVPQAFGYAGDSVSSSAYGGDTVYTPAYAYDQVTSPAFAGESTLG